MAPEPANTAAENFGQLWNEFDRRYALFETKDVDWDSLRRAIGGRLGATSSDSDLFAASAALLGHLRDPHVSLTRGDSTYRFVGGASSTYDGDRIDREYLKETRRYAGTTMLGNFAIHRLKYGRMDDSIGYIRIEDFSGESTGSDVDAWALDIDRVLGELNGVRGIIIDVRRNRGGYSANALYIAGAFLKESGLCLRTRSRTGPRHADLSPWHDQIVEARAGAGTPAHVVILADRRTFSAAEWFLLAMRTRRDVVVVGDTTAGACSSVLERELLNGWVYTLSVDEVRTATGAVVEGLGIPPDIVAAGVASISDRDSVLDAGMRALRR